MIISNTQIQSLVVQYLKQDAKFTPSKSEDSGKFSNRGTNRTAIAQDFHALSAAKELIRDLPDIREDRLARIQQQVKSGTYEVTDEEVAEKMIGRSLVDKLV